MSGDESKPASEPFLEPTAVVDSGTFATVAARSDDFARQVAEAGRRGAGRVGNLELGERLGIGAMGTVYKAIHRTLRTPFAVKVLHPQFSSDEAAVERFRLEAVACSRLRHENIVFVTDFGFEEGLGLYIAMEYLHGRSLGRLLRGDGALSLGRTARIGEQICSAMAAAHRLEVVHRDLKPDNIHVLDDPGRQDFAKVLDFGIAKIRDADGRDLTGDGHAVGTPRYMAPEQLMHRDHIGARTDIYALGCIFFAMLTGFPPFVEGSDFEILNCHVRSKPKPIEEHLPELAGTRMAALIAQMLRKHYGERPESMDEVRERLQDAILELMATGVPGAEYVPQTIEEVSTVRTGEFAAVLSAHPLRMTQVIERIRHAAPDSPSAALLAALPSVGALQGEVLCLALWGIIQQDLIDAELESPLFEQTSDQLLLLLQAVLESYEGNRPSQTQARVFRSLKNLLELLPKERRRQVSRALRPLAGNPLFPNSLLPGENPGSWSSIRAVLGAEINLPGLRRRELAPEEEAARAEERARLAKLSLADKLKQGVSVASLKAVLTHDITLFGSTATDEVAPIEQELPSVEDE